MRKRILVAGLPRTGTTYLFSLLGAAMPSHTVGLFEVSACPPDLEAECVLAKVLIGRVIDWPSFLGFRPVLFTVRDPRDRLVSRLLYKGFGGERSTLYRDERQLSAALALLQKKLEHPRAVTMSALLRTFGYPFPFSHEAQLGAHCVDIHQACQRIGHPHLLVSYDELTAGNIQAVAEAVELNPCARTEVPSGLQRVARTRSSGAWRHWFTPEDIELFRPLMTPFMRHFGYPDDWELATTQHIEPATSVDYFLRLVNERRANEGWPPWP